MSVRLLAGLALTLAVFSTLSQAAKPWSFVPASDADYDAYRHWHATTNRRGH